MNSLRVRVFALVGLFALACGAIAQASDLQAISSRLVSHESLHGRFTQTKTLSFLTTPIVSSGSFSLSTANGLDWLVESPMQSRMRVQGATVTLDGTAVKDRGVGQFMATTMQAFMTGNLQGVSERFEIVAAVADDNSWQMTLTPKSLLMRSVIDHIDLQGRQFLDQLTIVEVDDTSTLIEFEAHEPGA